MSDSELLLEYVAEKSEEAFSEIVRRHAARVYATCKRILRDPHSAEDAAQAAFIVLTRKAAGLGRGARLEDWLFRTATHCSLRVLRTQQRAAKRERKAVMNRTWQVDATGGGATGGEWDNVRPQLDAALAEMPRRLREAVVLKYFYGKTLGEIAEQLSCHRTTIGKRLDRALERLRGKLGRAGVSLSAGTLVSLLAAQAAPVAPAGLAESIAVGCLGGSTPIAAAAIAKGVGKMMTIAKLKIGATLVAVSAVAGGGGVLAARTLAESLAAPTAVPAKVPEGTVEILNPQSYWRWYRALRKPVVTVAALKAAGKNAAEPKLLRAPGIPLPAAYQQSDPAPSGWAVHDFDDGHWPSSSLGHMRSHLFTELSASQVCLRGKFAVGDPGNVGGLYLSIKYSGGVAVFLNGKEVARSHLPAGELSPETAASPYPRDAYVNAKGRPLPGAMKYAKDKSTRERMAKRVRTLGPLRLPGQLLRKGVNVLAVELRRSDYHPAALSWKRRKEYNSGKSNYWCPMGVEDIRLLAAGGGAMPNISRPQGLQVWNRSVNDKITPLDYGDRNERLRPVRIQGARNGSFCGQVVVSSRRAIRGLKAVIGDLKAVKGTATIPAGDVQVLYGRSDFATRSSIPAFDGLHPDVPAEVPLLKTVGYRKVPVNAALQSVFLKVRVQKGAVGGEYRGTLKITVPGEAVTEVPVELGVADWALPDPREGRTHVSLYQSPESVAMQYKVEMWSEKHWKLVAKSFELLAEVGNDMIQIPLVNRTQLGNDAGWVHWVKKPDGTYDYDFKTFDRYVALAGKHLGKPKFVCLHVWRSPIYGGDHKKQMRDVPHHVPLLDRKTGKTSPLRVPVYGTAESREFWKPALLAARARLAKAGLEKSLCLGALVECQLPKALTEFEDILPEAGWVRGCHFSTTTPKPMPTGKSSFVVLHEHAYDTHYPDPSKKLPQIWNQRGPGVYFARGNAQSASLLALRTMSERYLYRGSRGIGRMCLDYWPMRKGSNPLSRIIFNQWPESSSRQRGVYTCWLTAPGPRGAEPTVRFEALRESVQNAEALLFISEAADRRAAALGPELTAECHKLLSDRIRWCGLRRLTRWRNPQRTNHYGWEELEKRLWDTAARVAAKLGKDK